MLKITKGRPLTDEEREWFKELNIALEEEEEQVVEVPLAEVLSECIKIGEKKFPKPNSVARHAIRKCLGGMTGFTDIRETNENIIEVSLELVRQVAEFVWIIKNQRNVDIIDDYIKRGKMDKIEIYNIMDEIQGDFTTYIKYVEVATNELFQKGEAGRG